MAIRNTKLILKNSDIVNRPLPSSLLSGEAIVNTADGILLLSGVTTSTAEWTAAGGGTAGSGGDNNFFEVGSNLYDLALRNKVIEYEGATGAGLVGKFLSGTTNGFTLADISAISGTFNSFQFSGDTGTANTIQDSDIQKLLGGTGITTSGASGDILYFTLDDTAVTPNAYGSASSVGTFTVDQQGRLTAAGSTSISITASQVSDFTSASETAIFTGVNFVDSASIDFTVTAGDSVTAVVGPGVVTSASTHTLTNKTIDATANTLTNLLRVSGDTGTVEVLNGNDILQILGVGGLSTVSSAGNIITLSAASGNFTSFDVAADSGAAQTITDGNTLTLVGGTGIDSVASATDNITFNIDASVATSANTLDFFSPTTSAELASIISDETGTGALVFADGPTMSAVTINGSITTDFLTAGRVVYVGAGGTITDEAGFTYNDSTNTFSTPSDGAAIIGTGGLTVGSGGGIGVPGTGDVTVHGNLLVFGDSVSAFTSELYVEDKNITLNYNPTGSTIATSIGAGWTIQDGNGVTSGDVNLEIRPLDSLTGLTATNTPLVTEYTGPTGYENRGWVSQLNDIVIRSTDLTIPNGVRVLAEFDTLDGGSY